MVKIINGRKKTLIKITITVSIIVFLIALIVCAEIAHITTTYEIIDIGIVTESSCTTKTTRHIKWPDTHAEQCRLRVKWPNKTEILNFNKPALVGDKICYYNKRTSIIYKSILHADRSGRDKTEKGLSPCYLIPELQDI